MSSTPVFKNWIGGEWVESEAGRTFENRNTADHEELLGLFPDSSPEDVNRAVEAARAAFSSWRLTPAPKRAELLYRVAEILVRRKEDLARDMTREGLGLKVSVVGEGIEP